MSNSYTSPPTLVDPTRPTAGQTIRTTEVSRLGDLSNYCFGVGGCHNVLSQLWDDSGFVQDSTSFVSMCSWQIPRMSNHHNTLVINVMGFCPTAANGTARFTLTLGSNTYTTDISITDQSRYVSGFNQGTISVTASQAEFAGELTMEVKAPSGQTVEILGVQANWQALSSPLTTGQLLQTTNVYTPQGINRLAADLPLSSRFGVEMTENINTLRRRPRVLFNWSGVENTSPTTNRSLEAAAPRAIGRGDLSSFYSEAAIFAGTNEDTNLVFRVYVRVLNYTSGSFELDVMGNTLTLNSLGWSSHDLALNMEELPRSNEFGLSVYRVGVDENPSQLNAVTWPSRPPSIYPYIAGFTIVGV